MKTGDSSRAFRRVRPCSVSGLFYQADPVQLRQEIDALIRTHRAVPVRKEIAGLISPHAGYRYSGATAARGYGLLEENRYEAVVVVSPSHYEYFDGISVYSGDAYATPLGEVGVHRRLCDRLLECCKCAESGLKGHGREHAVEVQLPFLQVLFGEVNIVPVVIGDQRPELCLALGEGLSRMMSEFRVLLIASTDLSHYHNEEEANELDAIMIEDIRSGNYLKLLDDLSAGRTEACGGGPAAAVLAALRGLPFEILEHSTSGDVTGDHNEVVGYLSAVAYS